MNSYRIKGCPLSYGFFSSFNDKDEKTMRQHLDIEKNQNDQYEITIFPFAGLGYDSKTTQYNKTYTSLVKFPIGRVLTLIHETFMCAINELFKGDETSLNDKNLCGFKFDPKTNTVYPIIESNTSFINSSLYTFFIIHQ